MRTFIPLTVLIACCAPLAAQDFPSPQPTEAHKVLAADAGVWDAEIKMFLQGPDGPPTAYKGVETNDMVSNGLFARTAFKSQMGDHVFEGHGLLGYDPRTKEFTGTWVDSFTSVPSPLKGKYDAEKKTMSLLSTVTDLDSGQEMKQKQVTTYLDEKTKKFELFLVVDAGGQEIDIKLMEMTAKKRVKK